MSTLTDTTYPLTTVCLIGRPNVGKSSIFNALLQEKRAIVANTPGVTRDRHIACVDRFNHRFLLIDTGGLTTDADHPFDHAMREQLEVGLSSCDQAWLVIDGHDGMVGDDIEILNFIRKNNHKNFKLSIIINKSDGCQREQLMADIYTLGCQSVYFISAKYQRGLRALLDGCLPTSLESTSIDPQPSQDDSENKNFTWPSAPNIAIFGRPNAGKSTLLNRLAGSNRAIVSDIAGTTRDVITLTLKHRHRTYQLIDTAGLRRQAKIKKNSIEYFSQIRTLNIAKECHIAVVMVDAQDGITEQDVRLIGLMITLGRPLVVVSNKWETLDARGKESFKENYQRRLPFLDHVKPIAVSALTGYHCDQIIDRALEVYSALQRPMNTAQLSRLLEQAVAQHEPPTIAHHRIKLRLAHPVGHFPIKIAIRGKQVDQLPPSYQRYLERYFRRTLKLDHVPIQMIYIKDNNPYA